MVLPRSANLGASIRTGEVLNAAAASMPCVNYQCNSDFTVTTVSSNSFDLIGIRPENILGKRALWEERLRSEDRDRLLARLKRLAWSEMGSAIHKIANDQGSHIAVAHGFRKLRAGKEVAIEGCLVPLTGEFCPLSDSVIPQFVHKIGNHFQLINLLIGSLKRTGTHTDEIEALQLTVDRAVEFTRAFSHYSQRPVFTTDVDLYGVLQAATESIGPSCAEKKVVLRENGLGCLSGATLTGDAYLLELAFSALLQNALDAAESGKQIVVSARKVTRHLADRSLARIAIADNGCGMPTEMLAKAADPFVTSKRDRDGLGLSTACRIVEIHGGHLKISSASGKGTKVQIMLPVTLPGESPDV